MVAELTLKFAFLYLHSVSVHLWIGSSGMIMVETTAATSVHHATYLLLLSVELISSFNVILYTFSYSFISIIPYNYGIHLSSDWFSMSVRQKEVSHAQRTSKWGRGRRTHKGRKANHNAKVLHCTSTGSMYTCTIICGQKGCDTLWVGVFHVSSFSLLTTDYAVLPFVCQTGS